MSEFDGVLDLSGADTSGGQYEAAPSGTYTCSVDEIEVKFTGENSPNLPPHTPYLNVWWRVPQDAEDRKGVRVANKVFFHKLFIPPKDYDAEKAAKMKGSLVNFLKAVGYSDEQVNSKKFNLNAELENIIGSEADVIVKKFHNDYTDADDNSVQGVKPVGSGSSQARAGSVL
jgi:hypothetical protein